MACLGAAFACPICFIVDVLGSAIVLVRSKYKRAWQFPRKGDNMTRELQGIIPPLTTPFTEGGDVYEEGL